MNVLVTGGLGFIASNLVGELRNRSYEVWTYDLMPSDTGNHIRCDISKHQQVERIFEDRDLDHVYHAAAGYGRWNGEDYYENLWLTNVVGTKNIIKMQEWKPISMIFFGGAEVYSDYDGVMSESVMDKIPIRHMNDYAITKRVNELQIMNSAAMYRTETMRVRLFNVYGPRQHYTPYRGFIPKFIYGPS